jgi:hypothetical protein
MALAISSELIGFYLRVGEFRNIGVLIVIRRREISRTIPSQNKHRNGPGQTHRKEKQQAFSVPAADIPLKTERTPRMTQQRAPIDNDKHDEGGDGRGSSTNLAPLGSRAPRALILRLITRLLGIQDTRQDPPVPVLAKNRIAPSEVKPTGKRSHGRINRGKTHKIGGSKSESRGSAGGGRVGDTIGTPDAPYWTSSRQSKYRPPTSLTHSG